MKTLLQQLWAWLKGLWLFLLGTPLESKPPGSPEVSAPPEPAQPEEPETAPVPRRIQLAMLPAHNGDTLLLGFEDAEGKVRQIWIDGGLVKSYRGHHKEYLQRIQAAGGKLDLVVVTHVDQDHIGGVLALCQDEGLPIGQLVDRFWFNAGNFHPGGAAGAWY